LGKGKKTGDKILFFANMLADTNECFHEGVEITCWFAHMPEN